MNVTAVNVETTSISVSWDAVNDADRYTVTFIRATEDEQEGGCHSDTHNPRITVNASSTTASIDIGQNVKESVTDRLRAYSTYFITVVALTYEGGISNYSDQISIFTPQIGMQMRYMFTPPFIPVYGIATTHRVHKSYVTN